MKNLFDLALVILAGAMLFPLVMAMIAVDYLTDSNPWEK